MCLSSLASYQWPYVFIPVGSLGLLHATQMNRPVILQFTDSLRELFTHMHLSHIGQVADTHLYWCATQAHDAGPAVQKAKHNTHTAGLHNAHTAGLSG